MNLRKAAWACGHLVLVARVLEVSTPAHAASPECEARTAEMREELKRQAKGVRGPIEVPSLVGDGLRDLVRRYEAEKDIVRRAVLIGEGWPKAIGACKEPFARAFADSATLEPRPKALHLIRAIPDAFLACGCDGADPDALEVLMAMSIREVAREMSIERQQRETTEGRAAATRTLDELIRKRGSLYKLQVHGQDVSCERWQFRPGRKLSKGRFATGGLGYDYEYADGTLTLSGPSGGGIAMGCFFKARVGPAGPDSLTIDGERVFLTPAGCETARGADPPAPVKHLCPW